MLCRCDSGKGKGGVRRHRGSEQTLREGDRQREGEECMVVGMVMGGGVDIWLREVQCRLRRTNGGVTKDKTTMQSICQTMLGPLSSVEEYLFFFFLVFLTHQINGNVS